jgi:ATP-dependent exoDNAse (exonuclease V) beta subunit
VNATDIDCYDRVTAILSAFTRYDHIPEEILRKKADIGTRVHASIEAYNNNLGMIIENDEIAPYLESFLKWHHLDKKVVVAEQRFCCKELKITGQIDMIMDIEGENVLFDVKTSSSVHKHYQLQLSAYRYLAGKNGIRIDKQAILLLNKEGKEPQEFYVEDQLPMFLSCLDVYRFFFLYM